MLDVLKKVKEKGVKKSISLIRVKMKKKGMMKPPRLSKNREQLITKILEKEYKQVIIFENHFGYYNIMLQRPQHITRKLCDQETLVLYNSYYDIDFKNKERITQMDENHYVLDLFYYRKFIKDTLKERSVKKYLMVYSTDTVDIEEVKEYQTEGFQIIYEYVDDINPDLIFKQNLENILKRHQYLIEDNNTYVVTTATKLYKNVLEQNRLGKVELICNGVDCEMFSVEKRTDNREYKSWLREDSMKVGYYGAMASWVDYELLKMLVKDKGIQLILIGVAHDNSLYESGLLENENVKFFGKVPYDKLAGYANFFDVCIIPFVLNDITESTSPVKLFEYMSLQKPIVTTALPECKKYEVVRVGNTHAEFCELVHEVNAMKNDKKYKESLKQCAWDNSWESKAGQMKKFLER